MARGQFINDVYKGRSSYPVECYAVNAMSISLHIDQDNNG